jgi:hypothetical protein
MSELAANGNTISCEIQKKLFDNKVKIMIVIVLSVVVVRKKEPPLSSTDIFGVFRLRIILKIVKILATIKIRLFKKKN